MEQKTDPYDHILIELRQFQGRGVSVPKLAKLLNVKGPTLNAKFRRDGINLPVQGRTSYVSYEVALKLAKIHEYAIRGYPTAEEASLDTGIKKGTIKARCLHGINGRALDTKIDLTKKVRIHPREVLNIKKAIDSYVPFENQIRPVSIQYKKNEQKKESKVNSEPVECRIEKISTFEKPTRQVKDKTPTKAIYEPPKQLPKVKENLVSQVRQVEKYTLPPAPEPAPVRIIGSIDDILPETKHPQNNSASVNEILEEQIIYYDPKNPPSINQCRKGKEVVFNRMSGLITKILTDDPHQPKIRVHFPHETDPEFKYLNLIVKRVVKNE